MFISSAFFQKYERFVDKSAEVLMALTSDRMFAEIRYKALYMGTYIVKQVISPPIKLFTLAEIFICKQRSNKIFTWYGRRNDTFFANRPLTGITITFIRCLYQVFRLVMVGRPDRRDNTGYQKLIPPNSAKLVSCTHRGKTGFTAAI